MGNSWSKNCKTACVAVCLISTVPATTAEYWEVSHGSCIFSGDYNGAPLIGTGACPFEAGSLSLDSKGITSISDEAVAVFANMGQLQ